MENVGKILLTHKHKDQRIRSFVTNILCKVGSQYFKLIKYS